MEKGVQRLNVFKAGAESTFAVAQSTFRKLLESPKTKPTAVLLYAYLLSKANGPLFRVHIGELQYETGLSRPTYIHARDTLVKLNLISCKETARQGVWLFEVLGEKGCKLPTYEDYIKFDEVSAADIEAYYSDRLGVSSAPNTDATGNLKFVCPFHSSFSLRALTLHVTLSPGDGLHGRWICGSKRCKRRGGLIEFEQAMAAKNGLGLTKREAAQKVRSFFVMRIEDERMHPFMNAPRHDPNRPIVTP
jgi:hypothetical protein